MHTWHNNNYVISEEQFDYDLHCFRVYSNTEYLGSIYPNNLDQMDEIISALDNGEDPITSKWEDGCGHICTINGWCNE